MARYIAVALTAGAVLWAAVLIDAAVRRHTDRPGFVYGLASTVCHQRPERSFTLDGQQLPVCARCAGLYVSGAIGALAGWLGLRKAPARSRELLFLSAFPTAVTIPIEWLGLSELSNSVRAAA